MLSFEKLRSPDHVTTRSAEILDLVAEGRRYSEIANMLGYSTEQGVKNKIRLMELKLGISMEFPDRDHKLILASWWTEEGQFLPRKESAAQISPEVNHENGASIN